MMRFLHFIVFLSIFSWTTNSVHPFDLEKEMPLSKKQKIHDKTENSLIETDSDEESESEDMFDSEVESEESSEETGENFVLDNKMYGIISMIDTYDEKHAHYKFIGNYTKAAEYFIKAAWAGDNDGLTYLVHLLENREPFYRFQKKDKAYFESLVSYLTKYYQERYEIK